MKRVTCFLLGLGMFSCAFEEPCFMTIYIDSNDKDRIVIDEKFTDISEIYAAYYVKTKDFDSLQKSKFYVKLKIDEDASMGKVNDVKQELRKLNFLNIKYYTID